jgi:hypothetical protein
MLATQPITMSFLSIPPEIRMMIYERLLISPDPIVILGGEAKQYSFLNHSDDRPFPPFVACPSTALPSGGIIHTCKNTYEECLEILYSKNTFQFPERLDVGSGRSIAHMARFLERIGPKCANLIRHVRIPVPKWFVAHTEYVKCVEQLQRRCPNLENIELCFSAEHYRRAVAHEQGKHDGERHIQRLESFLWDMSGISDTTLLTFSFPVDDWKPEDLTPVFLCARQRLERAAPGGRVQAVEHMGLVMLGRGIQFTMADTACGRHVEYQYMAWNKMCRRQEEREGWICSHVMGEDNVSTGLLESC